MSNLNQTYCAIPLFAMIFLSLPVSGQEQPILSIPIVNLEAENPYTLSTVSISPDGEKILGADFSNAHIFDAKTGRELVFLEGKRGLIYSSAFSPDGKYVMTGSDAFEAKLWDVETGALIHTLESGTVSDPSRGKTLVAGILGIAFSPDSQRVLTGDVNGYLQMWDVKTGEEIRRYKERSWITSLTFLPNGREVLIVEGGGTSILDLEDDELTGIVFFGDASSPSSDWKKIITVGGWNVRLWDFETGEIIHTLPHTAGKTETVALSPDGKTVLIPGVINEEKNTMSERVIYNADTGDSLRSYSIERASEKNSPTTADYIVKFFPDGKRFLTVNGNTIHIWDISDLVTSVPDSQVYQ